MAPRDRRPEDMPLDGMALIEASAGTGKTYTITTLVLRLLVEQGLSIAQILIVTFTRAATAELRERVRARIRAVLDALAADDPDEALLARWRQKLAEQGGLPLAAQRLRLALRSFDEAAIFTIHGFCQRVLSDRSLSTGIDFDVDLDPDCGELLDDLAHAFWSRQIDTLPPALVGKLADLYGTKSGITPATLRAVARIAVEQPELPLRPDARIPPIPDESAPTDPAVAHAQLTRLLQDVVAEARQVLPLRKRRAGLVSYADLLNLLAQALRGPGGAALAASLRQSYRAALIDEFQDTDPRQYEIFRAIYEGQRQALVLIGDPKQAIYAFRGADVFAYLRAANDVRQRRYTLDRNYRSDGRVVRAVNHIFGRLPWPFVLDGLDFEPVAAEHAEARLLGAGDAGMQIRWIEADRAARSKNDGSLKKDWLKQRLPRWVAADLARRLGSGQRVQQLDRQGRVVDERDLQPSDIAVLCATNDQARDCVAALHALRIPAVYLGESSVLDGELAQALLRVLRAIVEEGRGGSLQAALATPLLGLGLTDLDRLQRDNAALSHEIAELRLLRRTWQQRGVMAAMRGLLDGREVARRLLGQARGRRRLGELLHLIELLQILEHQRRLPPAALFGLYTQLCHRSDLRDAHLGEAHLLRFDGDRGAVRVLTMHKSKGLEFGVVYCPYVFGGALLRDQDKRFCVVHDAQGQAVLDLDPGPDSLRTLEHERLAERLRVLYVALTRAKHQCVIYWSDFKAGTQPFGFLLHASPDHDSPDAARSALIKECRGRDKDGLRWQRMRQQTQELAASSGGDIEYTELSQDAGQPIEEPDEASGDGLVARELSRPLPAGYQVSSFTALTARASHSASQHLSERDLDALPIPSGEAPATKTALAFSGLRAGAALGRFVHAVLERLDFSNCRPETVRAQIEQEQQRSSVLIADPDKLVQDFCAVLDTPLPVDGLPGGAFCLRDLRDDDKLVELEFTLPVAHEPSAEGALGLQQLANAFEQHATHDSVKRYAQHLRELEAPPLRGFVRGFIDLVCRVEGRYYLLDYKSNWLGDTLADYDTSALDQAMRHKHYVLQYHLYLLALRRFLTQRLDGFDAERDLGGVLYLFVRGMSPQHPSGSGVYVDRPPLALLDALDAALVSTLAGRPT